MTKTNRLSRLAAATAAVWIALAPTTTKLAGATEIGIDPGWVVANGVVVDHTPELDALGVAWVRINFRLDIWAGPTDDWLAAYDRVVDSYVDRGYQIYGLVNDEAVSSTATHGSDAWIGDYIANAVRIIDHFKGRIRVFEIINEPNDWAGATSARFPARTFAKILQETYLAVKHHDGHVDDRCWQVDLVSGALFSFDDVSAAEYLAATYDIGRTELAWDWTREQTGSYPLDGIGYHLYVGQGPESSLADVRTSMLENLDAVRDVVVANEGTMAKQLWVSELGFRADAVGNASQADRLATSFAALAEHGDVAVGLYFTMHDFPDNPWGVIDGEGTRRPSFDRLAEIAVSNRPPRGAAVVNVLAPTLAPGELGEIVVTVANRGGATWTGNVRLAAAPGCPDAAAANALTWEPADGTGYATGVADARMFLTSEVEPDATTEIRIPVRAPDEPGTYTFAARMVDEGIAFFGATVRAEVTVAGASIDGDATKPDGNSPAAGCTVGGVGSGLPLLLAFGLLFVVRRRRHVDRKALARCSG